MAMQHQAMFDATDSNKAHYRNPHSNSEFEDEWEAVQYSNPYSNLEFENEWETTQEAHYSNPYSHLESEADQFFFLGPLIAGGIKLASKMALKGAGKLALKAAKKAISKAPKMLSKINKVQQNVQQFRGDRSGPQPHQHRHPRQLNRFLREGEMEVAALEAEFFGSNEFEGELANHTAAREIALTELLAHEAAHSASEREAEYLLRASLPITLRIMSGRPTLPRQLSPPLLQANARLVQGFYRQGPDGRQLLKAVPSITRRVLASIRAIRNSGKQITPDLVSQIMDAHTARVLSTPGILGPALVRNFAIRRATSLPVRQLLRLPQRQRPS